MRSLWHSSFKRVLLSLVGCVLAGSAVAEAGTDCLARFYECDAPVIVLGEGKRSDAYAYQPGLTAGQVLSRAGLLPEPDKKDRIVIQRLHKGLTKMLEAKPQDVLQPGDIVAVMRGRLRQPEKATTQPPQASVASQAPARPQAEVPPSQPLRPPMSEDKQVMIEDRRVIEDVEKLLAVQTKAQAQIPVARSTRSGRSGATPERIPSPPPVPMKPAEHEAREREAPGAVEKAQPPQPLRPPTSEDRRVIEDLEKLLAAQAKAQIPVARSKPTQAPTPPDPVVAKREVPGPGIVEKAPAALPAEPETQTVKIGLDGVPLLVAAPRDLLKIKVYDQPDLTVEMRVQPDGTITLPLLGVVHVNGLTPPELEQRLAERLANGVVVNPQVSVQIQKTDVFVGGAVGRPGAYPYESGLTVGKLLMLAGGPTDRGRTDRVRIERQQAGGRLLTFEAGVHDIVQAGDVVTAMPIEGFFIAGQVARPGAYPHQQNLTVEQAILLAGGPTEKGLATRVHVKRRTAAGITDSEVGPNEFVRPADIITVPEKQIFFIIGEVKRPGTYVYEAGLTVSKAINLAGGPTDKAAISRPRITRAGPDGKEATQRVKPEDRLQPDDVLIIPESLF